MKTNGRTAHATLENLLKYCLGYIKLINPALSRYKIYTEPIDPNILDPKSLFNLNPSGDDKLLLDLKEFYKFTPKELAEETEEIKEVYYEQKELASKLEEIKNKYKVDEYTKQINLNFGYFKVEVPESESFSDEESESTSSVKLKESLHPLFSIPIEIEVIGGKYYLGVIDYNVIPNIGFLQDVLGEDLYFEFSDFVNQLEIDVQLTLPLNLAVISKIWDELKAKLKLSEAQFDEKSFELGRIVVSLSSKSNYFLTQDLKLLVDMPEDKLIETSLGSWISDEDLTEEGEVDEDGGELFFPFNYDKHQLRVLSIISNKAAIVQGPPGTGKSQTIANLLCHLAATGKRVLFLSQKAQALKVVKDKLKQLEIEYLYGYIPNRFSQIYSQKEETDGAAYTLAGIKEYISFIHDRKRLDDNLEQMPISETVEYFNKSIEQQRTLYYLYNQLLNLEEYNINPSSPNKFLERFSPEAYYELKKLQESYDDASQFCGSYIKAEKNLKKLEKRFELIQIETENYSEVFDLLIKEVEEHAYDRGNPIINIISDRWFLAQVRHLTKQLPREVHEEFESVIKQNWSRAKTAKELSNIRQFFYYKECINKTKELTEKIDVSLVELGLDSASLSQLEKLITKYGFNQSVEKTKEYIETKGQIKNLELENPNAVTKSLHSIKTTRQERVKNFLRNRVKDQIITATLSATIRGLIARIARALNKSKRSYRTFDQLKQDPSNFQTLKEIVPVWIMDLEDASRLIPLESNMFDYIILDESSQCNLAYAIPAMYRSSHVIFFGDSEQMRDDSVKFKTNRSLLELAQKYKMPDHLQIKSKDDSVKSVLDIGNLRGFKQTTLLYHYRSPIELIGFSNENFYAPKRKRMEIINSNYLPYKDTNKVLINHFIKPQRDLDTSEKSNIAEAKYIAKLVKELQAEEKTKDKSIGVLTFFNEQAYLLKEHIADDGVKVSIIEGIQGDERDIIIYSFVISAPDEKKRYVPLTGEQGEINKELNAGRVNVAFSRARLQVHCVSSLPLEQWPDGIWVKRYLEYAEENGRINFFNEQLKKFDSHFEEEFYHFIRNELRKGFIIQNQVESCGFKIDFVVTDTTSGKRIAIECDGPTHFEDEVSDAYVASDFERQSILERSGWNFYRVTYSDWIGGEFDKQTISNDLKDYFTKPSQFLRSVKKASLAPTQHALFEHSQHEETDDLDEQAQKLSSNNKKPGFKEIGRHTQDNWADLVISLMDNGNSIWINEFIKSGNYIGYSKKGIGISVGDLEKFIQNLISTSDTGESTHVQWKGDGKSKIVIQRVSSSSSTTPIVDIRQYVESNRFSGFTRRGFRLNENQIKGFVNTLRSLKLG